MDKLFWIDPKRNIKKTYRDLANDLNEKTKIKKYIYSSNPYEMILELIHSMVLGYEIELLDYDMSETEIENLGLVYKDIFQEDEIKKMKIQDMDEILRKVEKNKEKWSLTLYTSGTTGRPKKAIHRLESLARSVLYGKKFEENIWGFAYNPTHFAGLQVFLQAFLNKNTIVYIFDLDRNKMEEVLQKYQITNISATPTFYRNIVPHFKNKNFSMKRATLGGEKFDTGIVTPLKKIFPEVKIKNIYASTECGSLFVSKGENFKIQCDLRDKVKISDEGELLIHKSLMGQIPEIMLVDDWYGTGDIVEFIEDNLFKFVNRKTEMINVGGYKVNPHEIEEEIMKIAGVKDALVKSRANRITGNILQAEVVVNEGIDSSNMEELIQRELKSKVQSWKIPRIFKFISEIDKTRTGKKVRK